MTELVPLKIGTIRNRPARLDGYRRLVRDTLLLTALLLGLLGWFSVRAEARSAGWTSDDTAWQLGAVGVTALDWAQTRYIAKHPESFFETNPRLGQHPTVKAINRHFALGIAAHTIIAAALPPTGRRAWQTIWIGYEGNFVYNNARIGIKWDF